VLVAAGHALGEIARSGTRQSSGLSPTTAGLILAGGIAVLRVSPGGLAAWAAAGLSMVLILYRPLLHPLILFASGGTLFGLADILSLW